MILGRVKDLLIAPQGVGGQGLSGVLQNRDRGQMKFVLFREAITEFGASSELAGPAVEQYDGVITLTGLTISESDGPIIGSEGPVFRKDFYLGEWSTIQVAPLFVPLAVTIFCPLLIAESDHALLQNQESPVIGAEDVDDRFPFDLGVEFGDLVQFGLGNSHTDCLEIGLVLFTTPEEPCGEEQYKCDEYRPRDQGSTPEIFFQRIHHFLLPFIYS